MAAAVFLRRYIVAITLPEAGCIYPKYYAYVQDARRTVTFLGIPNEHI